MATLPPPQSPMGREGSGVAPFNPLTPNYPGYSASHATGSLAPSVASSATGLGAGASINALESYVRTNYGYMAGFLDIPEVRLVLLDAARKGSGAEELYGALSATNWWKTTSSSAREWQQLKSEDPASAQAKVVANAASISDVAKTHGLNLSGAQIGSLAMQAAQFGWSDTQTLDAILKGVQWGSVGGGTLTATVDKLKADAGSYMVNLSDATAQQWSLKIARGELTEEGVQSILQGQASARFGYMKDQIANGVRPADYFAPIRDTIASTLEVGADTINMLNPKWLQMLEVRDPKTQELRAATMNEAMLAARQRPEWAKTKNAQDLTASMVSGLQQSFGR